MTEGAADGVCVVRDVAGSAEERIVLFVDALGATAQISFLRPSARGRAEGKIAYAVVTESALDRLPLKDARRFLDDLWREMQPTACVVSRQASRNIPEIVWQCERAATRLVMHLDDNLFSVPEDLGAGKTARHSAPERLGRLQIACRRADVIYASTAPLSSLLSERFPDKRVMHGDLYCSADPPFQSYSADVSATFGYMGTKGHAADLDEIAPAISAVLDAFPDVSFEVFGTIKPPASLARFGQRVRHRAAFGDYAAFLDALKTLGWRAGLAPLKDSPFNRCKADTKFVEYAQAGIPAVCVAKPGVYARPINARAALAADSLEQWTSAIQKLVASPDEGGALVSRAQDLLRTEYAPDRLLRQIRRILAGQGPV